jgi:hypothetical protein
MCPVYFGIGNSYASLQIFISNRGLSLDLEPKHTYVKKGHFFQIGGNDRNMTKSFYIDRTLTSLKMA